MKNVVFSVLFSFALVTAFAQSKDSTVYAQGKITSATTKEPVVATLSFQSLPYGNKVGVRSGSNYSFPLFDNDKYTITVEAAGFETYKATVDPATANAERKIIKDIELLTAVAKPEEPVHTVGKVIPLNNLVFDKSSAKIGAASHAQLDVVAKMLHDNPNMIIQIEGHTDIDSKATAKLNKRLSEERVEAVRGYLVEKGVSKSKVKTKAFGGTQPLYTGSDVKQRAQNRRVEARILEN